MYIAGLVEYGSVESTGDTHAQGIYTPSSYFIITITIMHLTRNQITAPGAIERRTCLGFLPSKHLRGNSNLYSPRY